MKILTVSLCYTELLAEEVVESWETEEVALSMQGCGGPE